MYFSFCCFYAFLCPKIRLIFFQCATFDPQFLLENPSVKEMLAGPNCDIRCMALVRLKYGIWVSRREAETRLVPGSTTTPASTSTVYTVATTTTTITSMSIPAAPTASLPENPSLSFGDYLMIGGNYVVTFLVFMGQFANYLYHHYNQVI